MTHFNRFLIPLLSCSFLLLLPSAVVHADPLTFTADTVHAGFNYLYTVSVSGPGFSFSGSSLSGNTTFPIYTQSELSGQGMVSGQTVYMGNQGVQLTGYITINGVQTDALFAGSASTPTGFTLTPTVFPPTGSLIYLNLPPIVGSFSVCLAVPGQAPTRPCDPNFLNVATVEVDLPGYYTFALGGGNPPVGSPQFAYVVSQTYTASSALAPEPSSSHLVLGGFAAFLATLLFARRVFPSTKL